MPLTDDPVRAKALSDEAVALANAGDFQSACAKLEQSLALHQGLGTEFHLAGCWSKIGRTASAYALFEKVATKSHELGQSDREDVARQRMETLLPKLSRVRVDVVSPGTHMEIRRDNVVVPESDWGKPVPVDRGSHELRVTADGKVPWSTKVEVTDPATIIAVQVPALADAPKEAPAVVAPVAPPPPPAPLKAAPPPPKPEEPVSDGGTQRTLGIVIGGVGLAALAGGILEGAQYLDQNRTAKGLCPTSVNCTQDEINRHGKAVDEAKTARTWSYVGVGVGSIATLAGTYLFLSAPHGRGSQQRAQALFLKPLVGDRDTWGAALSGSF